MTAKRYRVLPCIASEGIEFLADPIPRRIYGPGEVIEMDEAVHNVPAILALGQIEEISDEPVAMDGDS